MIGSTPRDHNFRHACDPSQPTVTVYVSGRLDIVTSGGSTPKQTWIVSLDGDSGQPCLGGVRNAASRAPPGATVLFRRH